MKIILASASPRRKELLEQLGVTFTVKAACKEEVIGEILPDKVVEELSRQKALEIAEEFSSDAIIIGADTVVAFGGKIMGKPKDRDDAVLMLQTLSGKSHCVYTGVTAIRCSEGKKEVKSFVECTEVNFYQMDRQQIEDYADTPEPLDKAGAYAIQGKGAVFVKEIHGDYYNVVGLPIGRLKQDILNSWLTEDSKTQKKW